MRFTPYGEPSDREIDAQRLPPYCPQCEEPTNNYDELCQDCQDMNPHSTHPSQDQDGKDSAFAASTAELFKPLPTIEEIKAKLKEWIRMAEITHGGNWEMIPGVYDTSHEATQFPSGPYVRLGKRYEASLSLGADDEANFIATSRTAAPLAWKCLLLTIEVLPFCEELYGETLQYLRKQFQPIFHLENR